MHWLRCVGLSLALTALPPVVAAQFQERPPYRDPGLPVAQRVADLLGRMSLEEKFWQLFMLPGDLDDPANDWSTGVFGLQISAGPGTARGHTERINTIQRYFVERTRLDIPIIPFDEAVHGLAREGATMFPQAIGLAAAWDSGLVARVAAAIARETRSRGIRQVLSPVLNLASDVRWGRVEETYGEDPYLAALLGAAFVTEFERAGIVATPKHFVANVGEGGRDSYPIDRSERTLEELFFPPFKTAIQAAGARSIMTAYNSVDGSPATQNRWLLTTKLKREWGFTGFVISDAAATGGATVLHHTEPNTATAAKDALEAGLDVVFQSSFPQHRPYLDAFRRGVIPDSVIDSAAARVLRVKFALGLFEHPYAEPDSAAIWNGHPEYRKLALEAARASIVLLKNDRGTLPLSRALHSIALIGADAGEARLGGYSGPGIAKVSILEGLRQKLGASRVRYAAGPGRVSPEYAVIPPEQFGNGLRGEYFDNPRFARPPRFVRTDLKLDFGWTLNSPGPGIPFDWYSVRWTGTLTVPKSGVTRIGVEGNDGYRLYLDGRVLLDNWKKQSYGARFASLSLRPGTTHQLRLEYFETTGNARLKLLWNAGVLNDWRAKIDSAVAAARQSDVVVIVAGLEEGEFRDRASLALPGHQEDLILRVAATGKPVIVVLIGGSAVTMSRWLERVAAVIEAWYPGEQGGRAVADVLFGEANPAGRLPITFPMAEGQLPLVYNHKPTGRGDDYLDLTGRPLFPFGFGLSYTSFEYSSLTLEPAEIRPDGSTTIRCRVRNVGSRAGDEILQLYLRDVLASVAQPVMRLAGLQRVHLEPGEEREVRFQLGTAQLRLLDREMRWIVEPGTFRVMIGASSADIRLRGELVVR
jgi:beta-glucosidase